MILCLDCFLIIGGPCHTYKSAFLDVIPMFETADELMRRKGAMAFERHALSWTWEGFRPSLVTYDVKRREVQGLSAPFQPGQALDHGSIEPLDTAQRRLAGQKNHKGQDGQKVKGSQEGFEGHGADSL